MILSQFIDTVQSRNRSMSEFSILDTKTSRRFQSFFNNETRTASNLAVVLWHIISHSTTYGPLLSSPRRSRSNPFPKKEQYILNDYGKFNLLVFDSRHKAVDPKIIPVELTPKEAKESYLRWIKATERISRSRNSVGRSTLEIYSRLAHTVDGNFAYETLAKFPLDIIIVAKEKEEIDLTAGFVTTGPLGVSMTASGNQTSTAGAIATDINGKIGATISYHGIQDDLQQVRIGKSVWIAGEKATVSSVDIISDSCFAQYTNQNIQTPYPIVGLKGPLSGKAPRLNDPVDFYGLNSGQKNSTIQSFSMEIPFVQPYTQLKVLTDPDTNPGDSGAALIDSDDHIMGFAFYRTGLGARVRFSTWIWADSVFKAHDII